MSKRGYYWYVGFINRLRQEYDAMGQLTRAHSGQLQQGHLLAGLAREYRYDRAGNLIGERHGREAQGYRLDGCGRVLESLSYRPDTGLRQEAQFGYTRQGLPLGDADATYWQQGRVCQRGDTLYDYDKAGRLISKRQLRAGFRPEQWHYRWDSRNQLCAVTTPNGTTWQYRYDPFGRRISKRCEQTGEEVCYLWDGDQIAEVRHLQRGQLLARRHWVWRGWELLVQQLLVQQRQTSNAQANTSTVDREQGPDWQQGPWQTDFAISKQNGEVIGLYNQQGELHWQAARASLWGHLRSSHYARSIDPSLGFAGQLRDNESGLCYNRFRYYDPQVACYISPDPIGILGGENNYGYVPNPVNWIDPFGLAKCNIKKAIKDAQSGKDVTVSSFKEADQVLYGAFPNSRKVTGAGNKATIKTARQKKEFKLKASGKGKTAVYHKDYQFNKDGILSGHEGLPNGHPHKTIPHINVLTPDGKKNNYLYRENNMINIIKLIENDIKEMKGKNHGLRLKLELLREFSIYLSQNEVEGKMDKIIKLVDAGTGYSEYRLINDCESDNRELWVEYTQENEPIRLIQGDFLFKMK